MTYSPITISRTLSALVIAGLMAAFSAQPVLAQTATKLNCKNCVKSKQIKNNGIKGKDIKDGQVKTPDLGDGAVEFSKLGQEVEDGIKQDRVFYETIDSNGAEATLVTQGPLELFARCIINQAGQDILEFYYTSSVNGWFIANGGPAFSAGQQIIISGFSSPTGVLGTAPIALVGSAMAPDGSIIDPKFFITAGLNIFGHVCFVSGSATAITGNL